jgi:hypothetical protein
MSANFDSNVALVSTTSMTTYLGIALGSTEESECDLLINAASRLAVDYTGRGMDNNGVSRLLSTSRTEYYDGDGTDTLHLRSYPISAVTSIYVDPDRDYGSSDLLDTDDYVYYENEGKICTDGSLFSPGRKSIKVTYTGGYTSIPEDLQLAIKELVLFWYKRNTDKRVGVTNISVGDKSMGYEPNIPESVLSTFKRYRDWAIA